MRPGRRVMIVGGGPWQVPLVQTAKRLGCVVTNTNLHAGSPAFKHADFAFVADVLDRDRQLIIAREQRVEAVVTDQSDIAVPTVAFLNEQLGLPGIGMEKAALLTNKHLMRQFLRAHMFPTPAFHLCKDVLQAVEWASGHQYPVVLKPVANQASRGVFKVECENDLCALFPRSAGFSASGGVIIEDFIPGVELTVEGFAADGAHETLAISRKRPLATNPMVAAELRYSPEGDEIDHAALRAQHDRLMRLVGLPFAITHAEYILHEGTFFLVEVAARGGGTKISSHIVPAVSGVPADEWLVRRALGAQGPLPGRSEPATPYAILEFFDFKPGMPRSVSGLEQARHLPGIIDVDLLVEPGKPVTAPKDDTGRHGYYIAAASSRSELDSLARAVKSSITVTYV